MINRFREWSNVWSWSDKSRDIESGTDEEEGEEKEEKEVDVLSKYKPVQLGEDEITAKVKEAIEQSGASSMQEMGKIMAILKTLSGSADMGLVSKIVKDELS